MPLINYRSHDRGQSEILGSILVLTIVVIGLATVLGSGMPSLADTGADEQFARNSLDNFATAAERVAVGTSETEQVPLEDGTGSPADFTVEDSAGQLVVEEVGGPTYISTDFGAVTYSMDDGSEIAYQGGGVFRRPGSTTTVGGETRQPSSILTQPQITLRDTASTDPTLAGNFITVSSSSSLSDTAVINEGSGTTERGQKRASSSDALRIQIQSAYYMAWYRYFTEGLGIPESDAAIDDSTSRVEIVYDPGTTFFYNPSRVDIAVSGQ